jgi:GNAT superfamily N-acetyltransferase
LDLETVIDNEIHYFRFAADVKYLPWGVALSCSDLPASLEVNRLIRLRDDGRGASSVAAEAAAYFHHVPGATSIDTDPVSEEQGIGLALRRIHVLPATGRRVFMTAEIGDGLPPFEIRPGVQAMELIKTQSEIATWLSVNLHDIENSDSPDTWRELARREAIADSVRLFLASVDGQPASTASMFVKDGVARIEMVETAVPFRRKGAASATVRLALEAAADSGAHTAFLFTSAGGEAERLYKSLGFKQTAINLFRRHLA